MRSPVSRVLSLANQVVYELERWVSTYRKKHIRLSFKREQQIRLLKLRNFSMRYHLEISEILDLVMPVLLSRALRKKESYGLGITVNVLTGTACERILIEEINKRYPDGGHHVVWKNRLQDEQLRVEQEMDDPDGSFTRFSKSMLNSPSLETFVENYRRNVLCSRAGDQQARTDPKRKRKPYRGNPWI